jgi:hypothetical protein
MPSRPGAPARLLGAFALLALGCGQFREGPPSGADASADADGSGSPDAPASEAGGCSQGSCPTGCCDENGVCQHGSLSTLCGEEGHACADCTSTGQVCALNDAGPGHACAPVPVTCTPQSCTGCCEGNNCRSGTDLAACGGGGRSCAPCPLGDACQNGACVASGTCGSSSCAGCCDAAICRSGTDPGACGAQGQSCASCGTGLGCYPTGSYGGGVCADSVGCGPENCPSGCCDSFYNCQDGTDNLACGSGGIDCAVCGGIGSCVARACTDSTCSPLDCTGCCDDFGVCQQNVQSCGSAGARCVQCPSGSICSSDTCR